MRSVGRLRLLFDGHRGEAILLGDVLRDAPVAAGDERTGYQHVISCPPIGRRFDPELFYGHRQPGPAGTLPRTNVGDLAYVFHALTVLRPGGTAAMLVSRGPLFRGGGERDARCALVRAGSVRAVVELPSNLLTHTTLPVFVLLLRRGVNDDDRDGVLFVDASENHGVSGKKNVLRLEDIERIALKCTLTGDDGEHHHHASVQEIEERAWSLSPRSYLKASQTTMTVPLDVMRADIAALEASRDDAAKAMDRAADALLAVLDKNGTLS